MIERSRSDDKLGRLVLLLIFLMKLHILKVRISKEWSGVYVRSESDE